MTNPRLLLQTLPSPLVDVLIVGAGFSVHCMGIKLLEAGMKSFLIIEKSCEIGGTWWTIATPAAPAISLPTLFVFVRAIHEWTRMYPASRKSTTTLKRCVERYGLAPYLRLNTRFKKPFGMNPKARGR